MVIRLFPLISAHRWASSVEHTPQVKRDIQERHETAKLGGGLKRIAGQNKKVI